MSVVEALPKQIQTVLKGLDRRREAILKLVDTVHLAEEILEAHRVSESDYVTVSDGAEVRLVLQVRNWRDVVAILRALAARGFRQMDEPSDVFSAHCRMWHCGNIGVSAYLPFDGTGQCRRVQVGTKTEPVYEWRCDEGEGE